MRRTFVIVVLVFVAASIALGQAERAKTPRRNVDQVIRQVEHDIPQSEVKGWTGQTDTRNVNLTAEEITNRKIRLEKETELVGEMHRAGVKLLAGTDLGNRYVYPGFSLHDELALLVQAGLSPLEALQTATINPARFFGKEKELGTIGKGKLADLVLLDGNPLSDINNIREINGVVLNGRLLDRAALDKLLAGVGAAENKK